MKGKKNWKVVLLMTAVLLSLTSAQVFATVAPSVSAKAAPEVVGAATFIAADGNAITINASDIKITSDGAEATLSPEEKAVYDKAKAEFTNPNSQYTKDLADFMTKNFPGIDSDKVVVREIFDINPKIFIIFATAFDNYTHEAFQVYAFDYLIKPFNLDRIRQTMERIKELQAEREKTGSVERQVMQLGKDNQKLLIQTNDSQKFINVQDIIILTRNDRQTVIYTLHGIIKTYESLQKIGERLNVSNFFRCHKGFIINADMVSEIFPWGNRSYLVKMLNTKETALMTVEKVKEFRDRYCLN